MKAFRLFYALWCFACVIYDMVRICYGNSIISHSIGLIIQLGGLWLAIWGFDVIHRYLNKHLYEEENNEKSS